MNLTLAYHGRSQLISRQGSHALSLVPNLVREPVQFSGALREPLRFREAISTLHDVVINDLRYKPRDKSAYETWKQNERQRVDLLRRREYERARQEIFAQQGQPVPDQLERDYRRARGRYWALRQRYSRHLLKHDPSMWRLLMPCDPVISVHDDCVMFECFSADESTYGCLKLDRETGLTGSSELQLGTTNVDYSWGLYDQFQLLRSYRETRFEIDPSGFEMQTADGSGYREEKIDLPTSWLRGFLQLQTAMSLPMRRVPLSRETLYSLLAWLKRHRAQTSPRALRFELVEGSSPALVLEPWEQRLESSATTYRGPSGPPVRIWGTRRLLVLARLLPLVEQCDVYLLGTGMPSFWVVRMGNLQLTVALSGWTTNDWTRGAALELLAPPVDLSEVTVRRVESVLQSQRALRIEQLQVQARLDEASCRAALDRLAHTGQVIHDLTMGVYRWRQVMPRAVGEAEIGPEHPELVAARELVDGRRVQIKSRSEAPGGGRLLEAVVESKPVELLLDMDGVIRRGRCVCGHHRRAGLRMGPCRHLLAVRDVELQVDPRSATVEDWLRRITSWAN